jgi:hypothetical protein
MAKVTDKKLETLEDDQIVTRRQALRLAAAVLVVGVVVSGAAPANSDTSNETNHDKEPDEDMATNTDTSNETNHDTATDEDTS